MASALLMLRLPRNSGDDIVGGEPPWRACPPSHPRRQATDDAAGAATSYALQVAAGGGEHSRPNGDELEASDDGDGADKGGGGRSSARRCSFRRCSDGQRVGRGDQRRDPGRRGDRLHAARRRRAHPQGPKAADEAFAGWSKGGAARSRPIRNDRRRDGSSGGQPRAHHRQRNRQRLADAVAARGEQFRRDLPLLRRAGQ